MVPVAASSFPYWLRDDVEQAARLGLWRAARDWDPDQRGFYGWAKAKIRWEIIDELRRLDVLTRRDRAEVTLGWDVLERLAQELGEWPSAAALEQAGVDPQLFLRATAATATVPDLPSQESVEDQVVARLEAQKALDRLADCDYRTWLAGTLRWRDDWSPFDIANVLGVSEAMVFKRLRAARELIRGFVR